MKQLTQRQKTVLLVGLAVLALVIVLLILPYLAPKKEDRQPSVVATIPEADLTQGNESKTSSYSRTSRAAKQYSEAEEAPEAQEPFHSQDSPLPRKAEGRRPAPKSVDELFGDSRDAPAASGTGRSGGGVPKRVPEPSMEPQEPSPEPPAEEPTGRAPVKRSGAVSSLDEDVTTDLGNGFSTLDGTDRWVGSESGKAYRCMFTRDEKVRSGQRVTVRLLEDLVVGGVHIPRNTHLQGVASIADRLEVRISSLDVGGRILSLRVDAFDTDGGKGIYCSDLSAAAKGATEQALSTVSSTLHTRLGRVARDAATVGASIVRNKSGEATVSVPAGYTFYIIETAQ